MIFECGFSGIDDSHAVWVLNWSKRLDECFTRTVFQKDSSSLSVILFATSESYSFSTLTNGLWLQTVDFQMQTPLISMWHWMYSDLYVLLALCSISLFCFCSVFLRVKVIVDPEHAWMIPRLLGVFKHQLWRPEFTTYSAVSSLLGLWRFGCRTLDCCAVNLVERS